MVKKNILIISILVCIMTCIPGAFAYINDDIAWVKQDNGNNSSMIGFHNTDFSLWGNGNRGSVFYAYSRGNAKIEFKQTKGTCQLLSYTKLLSGIVGSAEEWGKYQIEVYRLGDPTYKNYYWDDTYFNSTQTIKLPDSGIYYVYVRPYTNSEMTGSYMMDQFAGWNNAPQWWIEDYSNCNLYTAYPGSSCY